MGLFQGIPESPRRYSAEECQALAERAPVERYERKAGGRWITIGARPGEDGKKHGGTPVYIEGGRITKGSPKLVGRKIDALKDEPDDSQDSHRKQLNQSKNYERATWRKKAKAAGIDPKHLDQLSAEILAHDKEFKADLLSMQQRARASYKNMAAHYGWQVKSIDNLSLHTARKGMDSASVKGLDSIADELSGEYPQWFSGHDEDKPARLFELLAEGNPQPMAEAEAYETALNQLEESKGNTEFRASDDEVVPFQASGRPERYSHEEYEISYARAPKGGATSPVNGRWYEGGWFMPVHGKSVKKKGEKGKGGRVHKVLTRDHGYVEVPEGAHHIPSTLGGRPMPDVKDNTLKYLQITREQYEKLAALYNSGHEFYPIGWLDGKAELSEEQEKSLENPGKTARDAMEEMPKDFPETAKMDARGKAKFEKGVAWAFEKFRDKYGDEHDLKSLTSAAQTRIDTDLNAGYAPDKFWIGVKSAAERALKILEASKPEKVPLPEPEKTKGDDGFSKLKTGDLGYVDGYLLRKTGDDEYRMETPGAHVTGNAGKLRDHIAELKSKDARHQHATDIAVKRAEAYDEPNFLTDRKRLERDGKAFDSLPDGALVVSLFPETKGRLGKIVRADDPDRPGKRINRVKLNGVDDWASSDVEPLEAKQSWRAEEKPKEEKEEPKLTQRSLFQANGQPRRYSREELAERYGFDESKVNRDEDGRFATIESGKDLHHAKRIEREMASGIASALYESTHPSHSKEKQSEFAKSAGDNKERIAKLRKSIEAAEASGMVPDADNWTAENTEKTIHDQAAGKKTHLFDVSFGGTTYLVHAVPQTGKTKDGYDLTINPAGAKPQKLSSISRTTSLDYVKREVQRLVKKDSEIVSKYSREELAERYANEESGHWVTLENEQHVFIDGAGNFKPSGPGGEVKKTKAEELSEDGGKVAAISRKIKDAYRSQLSVEEIDKLHVEKRALIAELKKKHAPGGPTKYSREELAERYATQWDESKHPRDGGKFASKPGAGAAEQQGGPEAKLYDPPAPKPTALTKTSVKTGLQLYDPDEQIPQGPASANTGGPEAKTWDAPAAGTKTGGNTALAPPPAAQGKTFPQAKTPPTPHLQDQRQKGIERGSDLEYIALMDGSYGAGSDQQKKVDALKAKHGVTDTSKITQDAAGNYNHPLATPAANQPAPAAPAQPQAQQTQLAGNQGAKTKLAPAAPAPPAVQKQDTGGDEHDYSDHDFSIQDVAREQDWHSQYMTQRWGKNSVIHPSEHGHAKRALSGLMNPKMGGDAYAQKLLAKHGGPPADPQSVSAVQQAMNAVKPGSGTPAVAAVATKLYGKQAVPLIQQLASKEDRSGMQQKVAQAKKAVDSGDHAQVAQHLKDIGAPPEIIAKAAQPTSAVGPKGQTYKSEADRWLDQHSRKIKAVGKGAAKGERIAAMTPEQKLAHDQKQGEKAAGKAAKAAERSKKFWDKQGRQQNAADEQPERYTLFQGIATEPRRYTREDCQRFSELADLE